MTAVFVFGVGLMLLVALVDWRNRGPRDCDCPHPDCEGRCRK